MRLLQIVPLVLVLVACGKPAKNFVDASIITIDAPADTPPPPPGCDYGELSDATNDYVTGGPAEITNTVYPSTTITCGTPGVPCSVYCGKINNGHFDATSDLVDVDSYLFQVNADGDVIVRFTAPGAQALDNLTFYLYDPTGQATIATGVFAGTHGVAVARGVVAGTYELDIEGYNSVDTAAPIDYKLSVITDTSATRCTKIAAAANYSEALDNAGNNHAGNDVIAIDFQATPSTTMTASATDVPEPTLLTLTSGTNYRITGTTAAVDPAGSYMDHDTYKITTGPTTNQLSVRLNWPGSTADMDFIVFPEISVDSFAYGWAEGNTEDEFETFAVKPNTAYWLWVGMYDASTAPVTYDFSVCAETFTP